MEKKCIKSLTAQRGHVIFFTNFDPDIQIRNVLPTLSHVDTNTECNRNKIQFVVRVILSERVNTCSHLIVQRPQDVQAQTEIVMQPPLCYNGLRGDQERLLDRSQRGQAVNGLAQDFVDDL